MLPFAMITIFLLAAVIACIELGRRIRIRRNQKEAPSGLTTIDGAVFGLMGLLLAFTFSGAESRFDARRQLIVQESNAIGTAYLRIDLLPATAQPQLRDDFRTYTDARIELYRSIADHPEKVPGIVAQTSALQKKIWDQSVAACQQITGSNANATTSLVISSLNDVIDITTTRAVAQRTHPPLPIYIALFVLALASSLLAGFGIADPGRRHWLHTFVYAAALAVTIYTIVDLEFPRFGIIRIDRYDQTLVDTRNGMN